MFRKVIILLVGLFILTSSAMGRNATAMLAEPVWGSSASDELSGLRFSTGTGDIQLSTGGDVPVTDSVLSVVPSAITLWAGTPPQTGSWPTYPVSNGSDGVFNPLVSQVLRPGSDGIFNFTSIHIPAGVTLDFTRAGYLDSIYLLGLDEITIDGTIRLAYGTLVLGTQGKFTLKGTLQAPSIALSANEIAICGTIDTLTPVPLPAAFWLLGSGLGAVAVGRRFRFIDRRGEI